ncbi:MAG: hypothetical protein UY41_C0045G0007 [Candidatus Moranbacteria bacterium GW2011_GWE1_49_15]|nr:MAG: hypothetical protein UX75_C0049G0007 [Candidatus Moranbacteria bacterium GW2011_GWE2_47_10]KKW05621.1 MAG: hypothetical protein UY41_C0045G0007 [Candidatus Moranbacteria bacterium GW2011_GWE1_49_15]HBP00721.1 hypothetical protein [Candidatus Moranbacteria bacterium]
MIHIIETAQAGIISDAPRVSTILASILNFLLSIVGVLAIIALVISGIMYVTSAGDERRMTVAKKSAVYSVVGIAVALGALVIVKNISSIIGG